MSKSTLILTLTTLASLGLAIGLWISPPDAASPRIAELETKLREANATIARLQQRSGGPSLAASAAPARLDATAVNNNTTAGSSSSFQPSSATAPADSASPQTNPQPSVVSTTDRKQLKNLAEAEARYSDLISQFQLQPDEKEFFKGLAAKRSEIRRQATTKLQDPNLTQAQRQAILTAAKAELDQNDGEVRQFLNNDNDFGKFATWEQTEIERAQMDAGRAIFDNSGVALSPDQEDWLVKTAYTLRHDTKGIADPYHLESLIGTRVDQTYVQNVLQKFDRDTQLMLQNARSQFSQPQLNAINAWRTQQRVQVESRLWNMSRTTGTAQ